MIQIEKKSRLLDKYSTSLLGVLDETNTLK